MGLDISKITSSNIVTSMSKKYSSVCNALGNKLENSPNKDKFDKLLKKIEPTGANNTYEIMTALMAFVVVVPRVLAAKKRNPNDKEATKDEIKEILFRDIQTILIILLALNAITAAITGKWGSKHGLPLTTKPLEKVFDTNEKGFKGISKKFGEFFSNPVDKLKKIGKNTLDIINPVGGAFALNSEQIANKYSGYSSLSQVQKLFKQIETEKGDKEKIFNKVMDILIDEQKAIMQKNAKINSAGGNIEMAEFQKVLESLEGVKKEGIDAFLQKEGIDLDNFSESIAGKQIVEFFKDKNNALVEMGTKVNSVLRMGAFGFNIAYLGFGLPILNEKRLERKYLKDNPNALSGVKKEKIEKPQNSIVSDNKRNLYKNFLK